MAMAPKVGLFRGLGGPFSRPPQARQFVKQMEELNYDSLWAGEHIVLSTKPTSRIPPTTVIPDLVVTFSHLSAFTTTLRFGTAVINLPHHDPLLLAKQIATLDLWSNGRVTLGVGLGGSADEYEALGIPLADRGARLDEYLDAINTLWTMAEPRYEGRFVRFSDVDAHPRPIQSGGIPIMIGGRSPAAYRRAVRRGNGWFGFGLDLEETSQCLEDLRKAASAVERPSHLGELEITVAVRGTLDPSSANAFAALGVHRIVSIAPTGIDDKAFERFLEERAPRTLFPG